MEIKTIEGDKVWTIADDKSFKEALVELLDSEVTKLRKADFTFADLSGMVFKNIDFTGAHFDNANLDSTQFIDCIMTECTFKACKVNRAVFHYSSLRRAHFEDTHMGNATINECDIRESNLVHLGMSQRGYQFVMTYERGQAVIRAGCRHFILDDAREHWPERNNNEEGAKVTLARRVAHQLGWLVTPVQGAAAMPPAEPEEEPAPIETDVPPQAPVESPEETKEEVAQTVNA